MELKELIGKNSKELEKAFRFTHYLELKDGLILGKEQDPKTVVEAFFKFVKGKIIVVKTDDGTIKEFFDMDLDDIKKNSLLLEKDEGVFYDDDFCISYAFLGKNFFAYLFSNMFMFSAKEDDMKEMVKLLDEYGLRYFEPKRISRYY